MAKSLLIIEEDEYLAGIYARKFEIEGYKVEVIENVADSLKRIQKTKHDIIILDPKVSKKDNIDFVKSIKKVAKKSKLIIMTDIGERDFIDEAYKIGIDDYIIKGHFVPQEVVLKVKRLLK